MLRLRQDLLKYAPDVAVRFGLQPGKEESLPEEIALSSDFA